METNEHFAGWCDPTPLCPGEQAQLTVAQQGLGRSIWTWTLSEEGERLRLVAAVSMNLNCFTDNYPLQPSIVPVATLTGTLRALVQNGTSMANPTTLTFDASGGQLEGGDRISGSLRLWGQGAQETTGAKVARVRRFLITAHGRRHHRHHRVLRHHRAKPKHVAKLTTKAAAAPAIAGVVASVGEPQKVGIPTIDPPATAPKPTCEVSHPAHWLDTVPPLYFAGYPEVCENPLRVFSSMDWFYGAELIKVAPGSTTCPEGLYDPETFTEGKLVVTYCHRRYIGAKAKSVDSAGNVLAPLPCAGCRPEVPDVGYAGFFIVGIKYEGKEVWKYIGGEGWRLNVTHTENTVTFTDCTSPFCEGNVPIEVNGIQPQTFTVPTADLESGKVQFTVRWDTGYAAPTDVPAFGRISSEPLRVYDSPTGTTTMAFKP